MKWSEFEKIAREKGWVFLKHGSKHDAYVHPDREDILWIERHSSQEIRKGLYLKLKKQVGF
jgi:predicted RNA binding protein YcfA (HicA-like mRNA interferase family)